MSSSLKKLKTKSTSKPANLTQVPALNPRSARSRTSSAARYTWHCALYVQKIRATRSPKIRERERRNVARRLIAGARSPARRTPLGRRPRRGALRAPPRALGRRRYGRSSPAREPPQPQPSAQSLAQSHRRVRDPELPGGAVAALPAVYTSTALLDTLSQWARVRENCLLCSAPGAHYIHTRIYQTLDLSRSRVFLFD